MSEKNEIYIAKVKCTQHQNGQTGEAFTKSTVFLNNPSPTNKDGTPSQYYQGTLIWVDAKTGKQYAVKQIEIAGTGDQDKQRGFVQSLKIDLNNTYHVDKLN